MAGVQITVDDAAVLATMRRLQLYAVDTSDLMADISSQLVTQTQQHFLEKRGPEGAWQRLKPRTARERAKRGRSPDDILRDSNYLYNSIHGEATATTAVVGTPVVYARIHQLGGTIDREERTQTIYQNYDRRRDRFDAKFRAKSRSNFARDVKVGAHQITIPARPFLYIDADDRQELEAVALRHLERALAP